MPHLGIKKTFLTSILGILSWKESFRIGSLLYSVNPPLKNEYKVALSTSMPPPRPQDSTGILSVPLPLHFKWKIDVFKNWWLCNTQASCLGTWSSSSFIHVFFYAAQLRVIVTTSPHPHIQLHRTHTFLIKTAPRHFIILVAVSALFEQKC